jgi:hypothetical protein
MGDGTWTEDILGEYLGREESIRMEFKSGRLMEQPAEKVAETLSKEVSGFANTEGGLLFLGLAEEKGIATQLDGVPAELWSPHRLQQIIESNISPSLARIRIHCVPLSVASGARVVFVIEVPKGRTAHQAKDYRYYGRSEFESKPLRDFDVRLRMERGKAPDAEIISRVRMLRPAEALLKEQIAEYNRNVIEIRNSFAAQGIDLSTPNWQSAPDESHALRVLGVDKPHLVNPEQLSCRYRCAEYEVALLLVNRGESRLHDFEAHINITCGPGFGVSVHSNEQPSGGFYTLDNISRLHKAELRGTLQDFLKKKQVLKVWPSGECSLGHIYVFWPENASVAESAITATWRVFMDNVFPRSGELDLGSQITARSNADSPAQGN